MQILSAQRKAITATRKFAKYFTDVWTTVTIISKSINSTVHLALRSRMNKALACIMKILGEKNARIITMK